jgi:hypothetical protein
MSEPTDTETISLAGWSAGHARVLARSALPRMVAVIVDTNGDGHLIEFTMVHLDDDGGWREVYSVGAGLSGEGQVLDVAYLHGYAPGKRAVTVELGEDQISVEVTQSGWWIFLDETTDSSGSPRIAEG